MRPKVTTLNKSHNNGIYKQFMKQSKNSFKIYIEQPDTMMLVKQARHTHIYIHIACTGIPLSKVGGGLGSR